MALSKLNSDYHDVRRSSCTVFVISFADTLAARLGATMDTIDRLGDEHIKVTVNIGETWGHEFKSKPTAINILLPIAIATGYILYEV